MSEVTINLRIRPANGSDPDNIAVHELVLGVQPVVLIRPTADNEIHVDATGLSKEDLSNILRMISDSIVA